MSEPYDIIIGGGGFIGLTLARALHHCAPGALRIAIIERANLRDTAAPGADGRASTISASSRRLLEALGLWQRLADHAQPVTAIDITDSALDAPLRNVFLHFEAMLEPGQPAAHVIENSVLREVLSEGIEGPDITLYAPDTITAFTVGETGISATTKSGAALSARLLVAADGRHSALRRMAGIRAVIWDYPQTGIVATVAHDKPHHGKAVQHFLPAGPFAILPMTGNRSSLVWTESRSEARRMLSLDQAGAEREIFTRFGHHLGAVRLLSPLQGFPLSLTMARDFVRPRIALAGDAAHGLHWIAGQGLNHGFRDVAALTEVLIDAARLGVDIGSLSVLERYQRWRRFDAATSAAVMDGLNRLFSNDNLALRMIRDLGLGIVDRLPPLKNLLVREAAGVTGELPKLMRSEPV